MTDGTTDAASTGSIDLRAWAAGDTGLPDQRAVPDACVVPRAEPGRLRRWALQGATEAGSHQGPHGRPEQTHSWIRVMCLTGVDYFSTLGYQPAIAALAAGFVSPIATLVLIALTLLGALPVYRGPGRTGPAPRFPGSARPARCRPGWARPAGGSRCRRPRRRTRW